MPSSNIRHYIDHYLAPHPTQEVKELFLSTAILDFASASVALFEPIYLWYLGYSLQTILFFYIALYVAFFFLLPIGGRICRHHGNEHTILFSSPFLIIYYIAFFSIVFHPGFMAVAVLAFAIQKVLYWPSYHANFATWSREDEEGREISNRAAIAAIAAIFAPLFGGFVISMFGFRTLFIIVAVLILLSNVPLLRTPERFKSKGFIYMPAMRRIVKKENRRKLFAFFGFGEEMVALVLWPIFIATLISDMLSLGAVISFAMLANAVLTLYIGRITDEGSKKSLLRTGVVYTMLSWLVRPLISGGFGIFLMDSFYRVSKNAINVPMIAMIYEGARRGTVMDSVIFFEMSLALGKIFVSVLCLAALWIFPGSWVPIFMIAAVFTLFFMLMPPEEWRRAHKGL